uniref:Reverse transcriptase Ty1/copia-type domain-containing protein n=1 Tax=Moniliophthora roreri TaxID=221103 RepID=A0A0W0FG12_MONRR
MEKELKKMDDQKAFTPMPRPPNTPTVTMKWHYMLRKDSEGRITERQARLVVRRFTQVRGVHYEDTWAMVAKQLGHLPISADLCVRYKANHLGSTITVTYMDNVIGASDIEEACVEFVKEIESLYNFQFYGEPDVALGITTR